MPDSLIEEYERARAAYNEAENKLSEHYLPRIRELIANGDVEGAESLLHTLPSDSITRVFALDNLRQARSRS